MLFPTTEFAFFFAAVLLLWWGAPGRWPLGRKLILLAANMFFYCVWSWKFALLLLATAAVNHALACVAAARATSPAPSGLPPQGGGQMNQEAARATPPAPSGLPPPRGGQRK